MAHNGTVLASVGLVSVPSTFSSFARTDPGCRGSAFRSDTEPPGRLSQGLG